MVVGSKIMFECQVNNHITNVVVMSDGIREVDEDGNLVKW